MAEWWHRFLRTPKELKEQGVVGINMRNAKLVLPNNPRRLYGLVDDKICTKRLAVEHGLAVPETYGTLATPADLRRLHDLIEEHDSFVIKPARGSGGRGVLVVAGRESDHFLKPSGAVLYERDVKHHLQNILAGLFSLGGRRDEALIEYRVRSTSVLSDISFQGAPDIRIVMLKGYPLMAMLRTATRESDGRSNLHQGALGIGIDIATGRTIHAVHHGESITMHPDLKVPLIGVQVPFWEEILDIAVNCHELSGLGYLGVDMMIDEDLGPLMIEMNARPGLAIQLANGEGLLKRLKPVEEHVKTRRTETRQQKVAFARNSFAAPLPDDLESARVHD